MDQPVRSRYESRARIFKALAHPSRLFLVDQVANGPKCVCELAERVGADVSTVSRHLSVLRDAGILADEKHGNQVFYSLQVPCILSWYGCVEGVLKETARQRLAAAR